MMIDRHFVGTAEKKCSTSSNPVFIHSAEQFSLAMHNGGETLSSAAQCCHPLNVDNVTQKADRAVIDGTISKSLTVNVMRLTHVLPLPINHHFARLSYFLMSSLLEYLCFKICPCYLKVVDLT